jgi:hypothetical protein
VIVFEREVPVQVDDWMFHHEPGAKQRNYNLIQLSEEDYELLAERRKKLRAVGRNLITWSKVKNLNVPASLKSMTLDAPVPTEVAASFVWLVNQEVPDAIFDPTNVGFYGPVDLME